MSRLLLCALALSFAVSSVQAQSQVEALCPGSKVLEDSLTMGDFLDSIKLGCGAENVSPELRDSYNAAAAILREYILKDPAYEKTKDPFRFRASLGDAKSKEFKKILAEYGNMSELIRFGRSRPGKKLAYLSDARTVLLERLGSFKGKVLSSSDRDSIRKLQAAYLEKMYEVIGSTATGTQVLKCYRNPSSDTRNRLLGGALSEPSIAEVEALLSDSKLDDNAVGSFNLNYDESQKKYKSQLMFDLSKDPAESVITMVHEMNHGCNTAQAIEVYDNDRRNNTDLQLDPKYDEFLRKVKSFSSSEGFDPKLRESWPQFDHRMDFGLLKNASNPNALDSDVPIYAEMKKFVGSLGSKDKDTLMSLLADLDKSRAPVDSALEYLTVANEQTSYEAELEFFKELAAGDPSVCSSVKGGFNFFGLPAYSRGDFYNTLASKNLRDEILKPYSLKTKIIDPKVIFEEIDPRKLKTSPVEAAKKDGRNSYVYKTELEEFVARFKAKRQSLITGDR